MRFGSAALRSIICLLVLISSVSAQVFEIPTANHALYTPGAEEQFFVPTPGKTWESGTFGCVRSDGWQLHEGLDVRCLQRDRHGEPTDPVLATAEGTVAYINRHPALSNYGMYIVLRHQVEGIEIYSLYAHLSQIQAELRAGSPVKLGTPLGIMGRTANTQSSITKDRAHVHFELNLLASDRFSRWFKKTNPGERNDHGEWNGLNLLGLDPRLILLQAHSQGASFSLKKFIQTQTELCRVFVRKTSFPWLQRYPGLIRPNPIAQKEGVAGYEMALNYNGVPFEVIPRAASEIKGTAKYQLLSVNEAEYHKNPARKLVSQSRSRWQLAPHGIQHLDMLTY